MPHQVRTKQRPTFASDLARGEAGERAVKAWLTQQGYTTTDATREEQAQGIDFVASKGGQRRAVEVKWDSKAAVTGNVFLETVADMARRKPGWAVVGGMGADVLLYVLDDVGESPFVLVCDAPNLWAFTALALALRDYPRREVGNGDWVGEGLLVPVHDFKGACRAGVYMGGSIDV